MSDTDNIPIVSTPEEITNCHFLVSRLKVDRLDKGLGRDFGLCRVSAPAVGVAGLRDLLP